MPVTNSGKRFQISSTRTIERSLCPVRNVYPMDIVKIRGGVDIRTAPPYKLFDNDVCPQQGRAVCVPAAEYGHQTDEVGPWSTPR